MPLPGEFGATYVAVVAACALNVPEVADHVTPALDGAFATVAVSAMDWFSTSPIAFGVIVTLTTGGGGPAAAIVIVADADFVPSVTDVAVSVTVGGFGTALGAVYVIAVPEALVVADSDPHPAAVAHEADQVTPFAAVSLLTIAVKLFVALVPTDAVVGDTATTIAIGLFPPSPDELDAPPHAFKSPLPAKIAAAHRN
jgi:hypothetical protein